MSAVLSPCLRRNAYDAPALTYDHLAEGFRYDPASQVTNILHQLTATSMPINQAAYVYNGVGNRTSLTDRRGAQTFGYDNLDRLTSASHPLLATPQAFAYDPVGNRTTGGSVVNAGNQLTADSNFSYQYEDNGNLTRKTLLASGNFTQYTYDAENRLTKVEDFAAGNPTPTATSTYRYDGLGRRIEKVTPTGTRRYIYDGEDILLEYDGNNVLQARYTHGPGIDEPIAVTKGGSTFFYHQDGLGSVTDLTDSAGATAKSYAYDAYGNILESPGTVDQPYTYTGREFDAESGLYQYRARAYDSQMSRFISEDPILTPFAPMTVDFDGQKIKGSVWLLPSLLQLTTLTSVQRLNPYTYVDNTPINKSDPMGLYGPAGAAGAAAFSFGFQFIGNYLQTGDISKSFRCVNWVDVGISAVFGAIGPGFYGQILRGQPGPYGISYGGNAAIYFMTSLPLSTITKIAAPDYRLGTKCECQGLGTVGLASKFIQF